jgi:hypothetical protein
VLDEDDVGGGMGVLAENAVGGGTARLEEGDGGEKRRDCRAKPGGADSAISMILLITSSISFMFSVLCAMNAPCCMNT